MKCPQCGAPADAQANNCKFCGAALAQAPQQPQAPQYAQPQYAQPQYAQPQYAQPQYAQPQYAQPQYAQPQPVYTTDKSKVAAGVLGILLGGIGAHKFYLGHVGKGIAYLLFCWTGIPGIIGLVEGIIYLTSSDEKFARQYVKH